MIIDSEAAQTTTPPPGFGMIPAWLAWKQPSGNAVLVYLHLALFGKFNTAYGVYEECRPSRETLANGGKLREKTGYPGTGLSVATIDRALAELKKLGAAIPHQRWDDANGGQLPTIWTLQYNAPAASPEMPVLTGVITGEEGGHHPRGGGVITGEEGGSSPVIENPEPSTQRFLTQRKTSLSAPVQVAAASEPPSAEREIASNKKTNKSDTSGIADGSVGAALDRMLAEAKVKHPTWGATQVRAVLREALADRGDVAKVEAAWKQCLAHPQTTAPGRFNKWHDAPWWSAAVSGGSAAKSVELPWCGKCDPQGRWIETADGRAAKCPDCGKRQPVLAAA